MLCMSFSYCFNSAIEVITPPQQQQATAIVVEQGRPVRVRCSVTGDGLRVDSLNWYKIVDGVRELGKTEMQYNIIMYIYKLTTQDIVSC